MSLIVGGHPASAAFDPSIFYSAISRSFLRDRCSTPCTSGTHQSMVTFRTPYTAFTILADFFVLDDLGGFDTILGLQIWQSCVRLHCTEFPSALPRIQSALNVPLPPFPPSGSFGPVLSPGVVSDNDTVSDMTRAALPDTLLLAAPQLGSSAVVGSPSAYPYPIVCESTPSCSTLTQINTTSPSSLQLLRASLFRNSVTGIRCSAFVQDMTLLTRYAALHGIDLPGVVDARLCRQAVLHHILSGQCFATKEKHSNEKEPACQFFTADFETKSEFFKSVAGLVQSSKAVDLPVEKLMLMLESVCIKENYQPRDTRRQMIRSLHRYLSRMQDACVDINKDLPLNATDILIGIEHFSLPILLLYCHQHGVDVCIATATVSHVRDQLSRHLVTGMCYGNPDSVGCSSVVQSFCLPGPTTTHDQSNEFKTLLLDLIGQKLKVTALRSILDILDVRYIRSDNKRELQGRLKLYADNIASVTGFARKNTALKMEQIRTQWPSIVPLSVKEQCIRNFMEQTSSDKMKTFTCASCSVEDIVSQSHELNVESVDMSLLNAPNMRRSSKFPLSTVDSNWLDEHCVSPDMPTPLSEFSHAILEKSGIKTLDDGSRMLLLCQSCHSALKNKKTPALSLANHLFVGIVPRELKELTVVEEAMISRCRAKSWIIQLKEENGFATSTNQRALKGNIIIFPQKATPLANLLPPSLEELSNPICVIFVGSSHPSDEWLRNQAKPLTIRPDKVRAALMWLKLHNKWYKDIVINEDLLGSLPEVSSLPVHIEHVRPDDVNESLTDGYDHSVKTSVDQQEKEYIEPTFESVVIADVDGNATVNELRAAAMRHIKKGGSYVEIPHGASPVNEFFNPSLFPMIYPTLFPYGIGGFEDHRREYPVSMKRHVKQLLSWKDRRFQEHYAFPFTVFNILQRREMLLSTSLKTKRSSFPALAKGFATVSTSSVAAVARRLAQGDPVSFRNSEEHTVSRLMEQVNLVTSNVPGSSSSLVNMRNQIRALMTDQGLPSFFITINPADVYNPLVRLMAGSEIDVDNMFETDVPRYWDQATLVAKNPVVAAKFFNVYIRSFLSALLGHDPDRENTTGGILGVVKAHYGCIEAQGRGSLHCHMMVWLEGGLNPNEIKRRALEDPASDFCTRLIQYLDDTISNCIPSPPEESIQVPSDVKHPCSVRGTTMKGFDQTAMNSESAKKKDLHNLVRKCQIHTHTGTCYKYSKGNTHPKECRFGLDAARTESLSFFNPVNGELTLRCLDGLVNNFNEYILRAIRCNMDIKFIGSGASAKAVLYYITNYITKSQLKAHVAYAALERAVKRLDEHEANDDPLTVRAKKLLQKCAYMMISQQELSAQQVCTNLLGLEDHFTSHSFQNFYWTPIEKFLESQQPSPECSIPKKPSEFFDTVLEEVARDKRTPFLSEAVGDIDGDESEVENPSDDEDDEVAITLDSNGDLSARGTALDDYRFRPHEVEALSLWEAVARCKKIRKPKTTARSLSESASGDFPLGERDVPHDGKLLVERSLEITDRSTTESLDDILNCADRIRPKFLFTLDHPEYDSHLYVVEDIKKRKIPVPIGPAIPRRDRTDIRPRYCRLMLMLFKPWRTGSDLRTPFQSWEDAFDVFLHSCPVTVKAILENMQILHECRDSRDDHFASRANARRLRQSLSSSESGSRRWEHEDDFLADSAQDTEIINHLLSIDMSHSNAVAFASGEALECVNHMDAAGAFGFHEPKVTPSSTSDNKCEIEQVSEEYPDHEQAWKDAYEQRKLAWKRKAIEDLADIRDDEGSSFDSSIREVVGEPSSDDETMVKEGFYQQTRVGTVGIDEFISQYTPRMNAEQERAFRIVASHSQDKRPEPLRMYLGGPGGSGKSHVISALKQFFENRQQSRRFRLASYTGVAAKNISGMTLHAALSLISNSGMKINSKSHKDLIAMWQGVDYLFVDEVSMLGCRFMLKISRALGKAKQNELPFGGINIIFAGDFAQLGPVRDPRLFSFVDTTKVGTVSGQEAVFGKLLWLSVTTVVLLTVVMRQEGECNRPFVELLQRLRTGSCTEQDYAVLSSRTLQTAAPDWTSEKWQHTPTIVSNNRIKDIINERATEAYAQRTGQELHWYYAADSRHGQPVDNPLLQDYLSKLDSGKTSQRLGRIPLVIGMPVMITQNFDVDSGVVNGCHGILKSIRYRTDSQGFRHAISCVVDARDTTARDSLPFLFDKHHVAVIEDKISMSFTHEYTKKRCSFQRTQLPLAPAFAMTAHKAQGQTLATAIIDIESCRGTESPYVMASRVKSLDGLLILRPFQLKKIQCRQSEDSRNEHARLKYLAAQTVADNGPSEGRMAMDAVTSRIWRPGPIPNEDLTSPQRLANIQTGLASFAKGCSRRDSGSDVRTRNLKKRKVDSNDCALPATTTVTKKKKRSVTSATISLASASPGNPS